MALTRNCSIYNEIDNFEVSESYQAGGTMLKTDCTGTENTAYFIGNRTNVKQLDPRRTQH
jgi:hypothetical protein